MCSLHFVLLRCLRGLETKRAFLISAVVFRLLLELTYLDFVHPIYEYAGFLLNFTVEKYIESWAIQLALLLVLPSRVKKPSDYLVVVALFSFITPLLVFYSLAGAERWVLYLVVLQYVLLLMLRSGTKVKLVYIKNGQKYALILSFAGALFSTVWMFSTYGVSNFNLDLDAVYEFREEANEQLFSGLAGYLIAWTTTVLGPLLLMVSLKKERYFYALLVVLLHVFWFGITSHKSVLFYPALVFSLWTWFRFSNALSLIPIGMGLLVLVSIISYYMTDSLFLSGMFIRRVFFVPSHLTFTYFDFFSANQFVYWSNSFMSGIVSYPYSDSVAIEIGKYLGDSSLWANNSFFSTGFMHAGVFGVLLYGVVAGGIFKLIDSFAAKGVPVWISLSVVVIPSNTLFTSSDLTTTLLTHGLGVGMLMLYLLGSESALR